MLDDIWDGRNRQQSVVITQCSNCIRAQDQTKLRSMYFTSPP